MSRKIAQIHEPFRTEPENQTTDSKIIITQYQQSICSFLLKNNRLLAVGKLDDSSKIGSIYIGKVKNIVKNLDACFVEIANKEICFLPLKEATNPILINRTYDGRLVQGDELLVQITKDALKTKQAGVTCQLSLTDDFFVFTLGNPQLGISSKLSKPQKNHIKQLLTERNIIDSDSQIIPASNMPAYGLVIRTEAQKLLNDREETFFKELTNKHLEFLHFIDTAKHKSCFSCVKPRKMPYKALLDICGKTMPSEVVTDLNEAYTSLQATCNSIRLYSDDSYSLKKLYSLESKIQEALGKTVWLKSGANLVIEQTECLNTIDVNSGKRIKNDMFNDSVWQINVEAAHEAALQIRLRNLSGIIIIDFINMEDKTAKERLIQLMKELVATDPVTTNVVDITPLGLMEITRKKVNKSLSEQF